MTTPVVVIGAGFLGRAVAGALVAAGHPTTVITRRAVPPLEGARMVTVDLGDRRALEAAIEPGTAVVFAAGNSVPAADEHHPGRAAAEVTPLVSVLEAVRHRPGASLLFLSSGGAVYGEPDSLPVDETHPLRPLSAYGAAKVASETYVRYYRRRHGLAATSLRCGNAYGPGQVPGRGQGLVGELLNASGSGRPIELWGDGSVRRDFVHVGDVARAILGLCGRADLPEAINVGTGQATSVLEVIDLVSQVTGRPVTVDARPPRPFDVRQVALDIRRLQTLIEFDPITLPQGIGLTWAAMVADPVA